MRVFRQKNCSGKLQKNYTIELRDHLRTNRKFAGFSDKSASQTLGCNLEKLMSYKSSGRVFDAELISFIASMSPRMHKRLVKIGVLDESDCAITIPLMKARVHKPKRSAYKVYDVTGGYLLDYKRHLEAKGLSESHIKTTIANIAKLVSELKWSFVNDITAVGLEKYINNQRDYDKGIRSINSVIVSIKSFCNWLVKNGALYSNPLKKVAKISDRGEKLVERRALSELEIARLLDSNASIGSKHHGLTAEERAIVYELALTSGLRYNEILTLVRSDFDFNAHTVTVQGKNAKNSKTVSIPLKSGLERKLEGYFAMNPALLYAQAFPHMQKGYGSKMIKVDLDKACIPYNNEYGKADFHSLRHTFCTMLAKSGVQPQIAMKLMRHSSLELTMNYYTHILLDDKRTALELLPEFGVAQESREVVNGSTQNIGYKKSVNKVVQGGQNRVNLTKTGDFQGSVNRYNSGIKKADNSLCCKELTASSFGTCSGIRTQDLLIKSQLL